MHSTKRQHSTAHQVRIRSAVETQARSRGATIIPDQTELYRSVEPMLVFVCVWLTACAALWLRIPGMKLWHTRPPEDQDTKTLMSDTVLEWRWLTLSAAIVRVRLESPPEKLGSGN